MIPFVLMLKKVPLKRILSLTLVSLAAFCVVMSPWWIRNAEVHGRFVPFTTSSAYPLLRGTYTMFDMSGYEELANGVFATKAEMSDWTPQDELAAGSRYAGLALVRMKDQLLHHPARFFAGRAYAIGAAFSCPTYTPSHPDVLWKATQPGQIVLILLPAALAAWMRRRDRRVARLWSLPLVVGLV